MVEQEPDISSTQYIYIVASVERCEVVWIWKLLASIFDLELEPTLLHYDNKSCVKLTENLVFHDKSKIIEIKYHYIWDMV
jgi:hypothetical protein